MIDVDFDKTDGETFESYMIFLEEYVVKHPEFTFDIYQSRNGLHVFIISQEFDYKNINTVKLMLELKCDFYYIIYSHIRGFCVRLNRKIGENTPIYKYINRIGKKEPIARLESLVKLHYNFLELYANGELSKMR